MDQWTYTHPHDPHKLSMHDCKVTQIDLECTEGGGRMAWHFADGVWVTPAIECHEITEICRTAEARVIFAGKYMVEEYDPTVAVCIKSRWHGKDKRLNTETWEHMTLGEFVAEFQDGGWSLEIFDTYDEAGNFLITGEIHTPKEKWWRSFRMSFIAETADYFWNTIRPDRVW